MTELNEYQTRHQKIDVQLRKAGWEVDDPSHIVIEVDTKQSDFPKRIYKIFEDTFYDPDADEKAYADYLLLDSNGSPIAVIEAKRTSKDPIVGQRQAEGYSEDIKKQLGKDVFIFLSNGYEIWFWNKGYENPRLVKGFHSRQALERRRFQNEFKHDLTFSEVNPKIVDRPYQIESVKRVLEGIQEGRRKFLIVHATGTGKTRVSMAIIDALLRTNHVQKVLFLADRKTLRDQAYSEGFAEFFPHELKDKIFAGKLNKSVRLYASTIQTFTNCYQEFSIGDFDLIISDECHRSIYNKWKDIFTYFDAYQIGLTATPSELIERDTFRFFNCEDGVPTSLYTYDEAVEEKWLVPFDLYKTETHFQIAGVNPKDVPAQLRRELMEKGVDPEQVHFDGTDIEKKVVVIGTNEAIVKEFMENSIYDSTGTLPAKSIFFAITKAHAKRIWEAFERLYPKYKGELARIITSDDSRADRLIDEFKKGDLPRIAISVDMLDTGVNVPEVCNLVFAKPVFSKIKFWQMIGRGTRSDAVCKFKNRLPNKKKESFLIFDCWGVFEWFDLHPSGKVYNPTEAMPTKTFLIRLNLLNYFIAQGDFERIELYKQKIHDDIGALPRDSLQVLENIRDVELASSGKIWNRVGLDPIEFLRTHIAPLMRYTIGVNYDVASYTQKCELLSLAIVQGDLADIERLKGDISEMLNCLPLTIKEVSEKEELLDKCLSPVFWDLISFSDAQLLLNEFSSLMKYKRPVPRPRIILDIDDVIERREMIEYGPSLSPKSDFIENYLEKVEKRIKKLALKHPTILKIQNDELITEEDIVVLEQTLNSPDLFITEETLQKAFNQYRGTLVQFIKNILGLYEFLDPEQTIGEAFKTYLVEKNYLRADQINFIRTIKSVFMKKKNVAFSDLYNPPFTNFGPIAPMPLFRKDELDELLVMCSQLAEEVF